MRFPFEEAISDKQLLKPWFDKLSKPQQVGLKVFYGLNLNEEEILIWSVFQESCSYDELGYPTSITPINYTPKEYEQFVGVVGRRSGKTASWIATIIAYEALLGGHDEYVSPDQEFVIYMIAHRMDVAKANMPFIRQVIQSSKFLESAVENWGSEKYTLKNGLAILPSTPSIKAQRGLAVPVVACDESGFWYTDPDSANPDFEVERALVYSQAQFPHAKRIWASTPWTREGVLWKYYNAGTDGSKLPKDTEPEDLEEFYDSLVIHCTTAAMENPLIKKNKLRRLYARDPESYLRESMARFTDSISGFFQTALINDAIDLKIAERPPITSQSGKNVPEYVAAIDPAFRHDSFAFTILHRDIERGVVQDVVKRYTPQKNVKVNPKEVLLDIKPYLDLYNIKVLFSDQYQLESLQQIALDLGIIIDGVDFTGKSKAKLFGNLQVLLNQKKLHLLDPKYNEAARQQIYELQILEKKMGMGGTILIGAPSGKHDDMAAVLALAAFQCVWRQPESFKVAPKEPSIVDKMIKQIKEKRFAGEDKWYYA